MDRWGRIAVALLFLTLLVAANEPIEFKRDPAIYARASTTRRTTTTEVDSAAAECLLLSEGAATCGLVAWGSVVIIQPSGPCTACLSQYLTTAIGVQAAEATETEVTTGGVAGDCTGRTHAADQPIDYIPMPSDLKRGSPQAYLGQYCSLKVPGVGGELVHPPCVDNATCTTLGAGTCSRTSEIDGGAWIFVRPVSDNTLVRMAAGG